MADNRSFGHFLAWNGGAAFIGRGGGVVPIHAHYATQVAIASVPGGVRMRTRDDEPWTTYDVAVVPSNLPHSLDVLDTPWCAVLFVEPETREGRALAERFGIDGIAAATPEDVRALCDAVFAAWMGQRDQGAVVGAVQRLLRALTGGVEPMVTADERVLRAIAYVNANLAASPTLEQVAAEACLSPSRFRHLFVQEVGMALRPYMLWRRLLRVWELLMEGESITGAAHLAGFADAAHLTRTSRRMFGLPPSALQMAGPLRPGEHAGWRALAALGAVERPAAARE